MIKTIVNAINSLTGRKHSFDPATLNDPVALQTKWVPAKNGGTNFKTHKLVQADAGRIEFHASIGAILFYLVFLLIGLGMLIGIPFAYLSPGSDIDLIGLIIGLVTGIIFSGAGGALFFYGIEPIVFDKRQNAFWRGRKSPDQVFDKSELKAYAPLDHIHAIQLISEYCRGDKSSYYSYELNLVLANGDRVNVIDHGNLSRIRSNAQTLSAFLQKPVWDGI